MDSVDSKVRNLWISKSKYVDFQVEICRFHKNLWISLASADFNEIHSHLSDLNRVTSNNERPLALYVKYVIIANMTGKSLEQWELMLRC